MSILFWSLTIFNLVLFFACGLMTGLGMLPVIAGAMYTVVTLFCAGGCAILADRS